jgi:hypothetical protein
VDAVRDLLVITPSRGRPERLREMLNAALALSEAAADIAVCVDNDDDIDAYFALRGRCWQPLRVRWHLGTRKTLSAWTNQIAREAAGQYRAFASLGDDHIPRTPGWDRLLLEAITAMGGTGIAYGDDTIMGERLPTAPVISADIVAALGWMMLPDLRHMCVDLAWKDIGLGAGCLAYVRGVTVEHMHWGVSKSPLDATYAEAEARHQEDRDAYAKWRDERMAGDIAMVRALREKAA